MVCGHVVLSRTGVRLESRRKLLFDRLARCCGGVFGRGGGRHLEAVVDVEPCQRVLWRLVVTVMCWMVGMVIIAAPVRVLYEVGRAHAAVHRLGRVQ